MLILVGVSVSVALNTGLFKAAQGAAKNTEAERVKETELSSGMIRVEGEEELIKIDDYVASLKGEEGEGAKWELTTDADENGEISVGDLVTHKEKTTEQFYVISVTGNTVAMLAAKNITKIEPLEQSDSAPTVAFSSTNYWGADNELKYPDPTTDKYPDLNKYTDKTDDVKTSMGVVSTDAIEIARAYGDTFDVTGRLMTVEEVVALGGNISTYSTSECPAYINTGSYWLGSAYGASLVCFVYGDSSDLVNDGFGTGSVSGVRPVVEISKSDI